MAKNPLVAYPVDLAPALRHAAKYHGPVLGHTRQATQGAVNSRNAHPFLDEKARIAWAHNGIILNDDKFGKFEVDSECLIGGIQHKDFSPYEGPIALLWIEDGKLHAFRKSNPLYRGLRKGAVYLASEARMLDAIGCHRVKELSEGFIYEWEGDRLASTTKVPINDWSRTVRTTTSWGRDDWEGYDFNRCDRRTGYNTYDGHNYWRDKAWHNHAAHIPWAFDCKGCKVTIPEKEVTEAGATVTPPVTHLVPIRLGASQADSFIEKVEGEEAERMLDEENLCLHCKAATRAEASVWCEVCLGHIPFHSGGH